VIGGFYGEENHVGPRFRQRHSSCGHPRGGSRHRQSSDSGKVGPPLETVKAFGDDFRLVGIGVSAKGRVFATAPSSNLRSRFSMVEVDPKTGAVTPYPNAACHPFSGDRAAIH
jgi:hypothetical protein